MKKKRHFKTWVLYLFFVVVLVVFFIICDGLGLIFKSSYNSLDISNLLIFIIIYETLKAIIKTIIKREQKSIID